MMKIAQAFAVCSVCKAKHAYAITDRAGKKKDAPKTCGRLLCGRQAGEEWAK